jgi:hypothetical protein
MEMQKIRIADVLSDPSVSYWLKDQYRNLLDRDPADAVNDAQLLAAMMLTRFHDLFGGTR